MEQGALHHNSHEGVHTLMFFIPTTLKEQAEMGGMNKITFAICSENSMCTKKLGGIKYFLRIKTIFASQKVQIMLNTTVI